MRRLIDPLLFFLLTGSTKDLIHQIQFLKTENDILRNKLPKIVPLTEAERRRLVRFGRRVGSAVKHLISIVTYRTYLRWLQNGAIKKVAKRLPGRPPTPIDIQELILRLASENDWGYTRILGELRKLGIKIARSTVKKILADNGFDLGPKRGRGSWVEFIQRHADTLWACDFLSVKTWTCRGAVDCHILFFIHVESRRVIVSGMTEHPDAAWMAQQDRNLAVFWGEEPVKPKYLILDNDTKFSKAFTDMLVADDVQCVQTYVGSPNMNAYAERFCQTLRTECLDHFVFFGERHLRFVTNQFIRFYNTLRPHQAKVNLTLPEAIVHDKADEANTDLEDRIDEACLKLLPVGEIVRHKFLSGLLNHYERVAA